jgi:hypothetical protein
LPPGQQDGFISFQNNRRNKLLKVLQGENVVTPPSQEAKSIGSEENLSGKHKVEETPKSSEVLTQKLETSLSIPLSPHAKARLKAFLKQGKMVSPSSPTTPAGTSNTTEKQQYTEIGTPITSLKPLQYIFGTPNPEIVFMNDITPISPEEMPPSDLFFSRKRKAIVKRESHQKDRVITKRKRMLYDGNDRDDTEFTKEVAGSLGAFATANQWSVDNLVEQL